MNKDIPLTGYSTSPSDRQCSDGELSCSYNLINEEGALSPLMPPPSVCSRVVPGVVRAFLHTVQGGRKTNMVAVSNAGGQWNAYLYTDIGDYISDQEPATDISGRLSSRVIRLQGDVSIAAVGNTLVLTSHRERHYLLWKTGEGDDGGYTDLGGDIPNPSLSLRLYSRSNGLGGFSESQPEGEGDRNVTVSFACDYGSGDWDKKENQTAIHNQVMGMCNKLVAECHRKGRFMFPFLVRYAWRLFDGTLTKHSAPVLMIPSTRVAPIVEVINHVEGSQRSEQCTPRAIMSQLMYQITTDPFLMEDWKDIVTSLEIFVSAPVYSYRQDVNSFEDDNFQTYNIRGLFDNPDSFCLSWNGQTSQAWYYGNLSRWYFAPPTFTAMEIRQRIEECSTFYRLCSIDSSSFDRDYRNPRVLSKDDVGDLNNLVAREAMTDDYDSRDHIRAAKAFAYNSRISLANISKTLYNGGRPSEVWAPVNDMVSQYEFQIYYYVRTNAGVSVVTSGPESDRSAPVPYLYYPNMGCYKAVIRRGNEIMEVQMRPHKFLNGAVWCADPDTLMPSVGGSGANTGGFIPQWWTSTGGFNGIATSNPAIALPNKIYTSEVDNPFVTLVTGISTVGQGEILGVSTAAKALSQGQFGQFPMYAFSTDGVWALSVSPTGGFSSVQPITQDVCTNPDSITQLDSSVVFVTRRGLMQLSGSAAQCLTERISSEDPFDLTSLRGMDRLHVLLGHAEDDSCMPTLPFNEYLSGAVVVYDYVHQRLYLGNPGCRYTYVYSLKSGQWGWYGGSLAIPVSSYPRALAVLDRDNTTILYDFSSDRHNDGTMRTSLMVTRPIKLDEADTLKTADAVYFRGLFLPTNVSVILWGSRDMANWNLIGSSDRFFLEGMRGDGYRYFRIGALTRMLRGGRVTGISVSYRPKLNNRIR